MVNIDERTIIMYKGNSLNNISMKDGRPVTVNWNGISCEDEIKTTRIVSGMAEYHPVLYELLLAPIGIERKSKTLILETVVESEDNEGNPTSITLRPLKGEVGRVKTVKESRKLYRWDKPGHSARIGIEGCFSPKIELSVEYR